MKNERWANIFERLEGAALSAGTRKKYGSALNLYLQFRAKMKLDKFLDISERALLSFAVWASERGLLSGESIAAYISGVTADRWKNPFQNRLRFV
jgi:Phage integrase, N-terminal SAM-like domain